MKCRATPAPSLDTRAVKINVNNKRKRLKNLIVFLAPSFQQILELLSN